MPCLGVGKKVCFRACLHEGGGPQIGEVTCGGSPHLSCKRNQIKMRDFMDRRVTSPDWGPQLHVNRLLQQGRGRGMETARINPRMMSKK